jgi:putative aldouronate transport system permease protein
VYGLLWGFPMPIILAFLLNRIQRKKVQKNLQLILYLPNFVSVIVLCGIVRILLSVTGPVNLLFGTQINFMTMPEAWRTIYIVSGIWQGAGWASIMYTASLSNASQELREAAIMDGASIWQQIKVVEWPAIKDMVIIQFILQAGNIMSIGFEKAFALQTDMNLSASEIIATYVYKKGLLDGDYSFSTAVGLFNAVINVVLLIAVNFIVKKMNEGKGL